MTEPLRSLTAQGSAVFRQWLERAAAGSAEAEPRNLLEDPAASEALPAAISVDPEPNGAPFSTRYEFGTYLATVLAPLEKASISRRAGLWNWLSLFYMPQLAPSDASGRRRLDDLGIYFVEENFNFRTYYRHAIRTAWLAANEHGPESTVLLIPAGRAREGVGPLAHRGEIIEQLASRQWMFGSRTVIAGARRLYMDLETERPKRGAGGSGAGSPRRLAAVIQQLEQTYDLRDCSPEQFLALLPDEFDRWKPVAV